jgi:hypothetical protein
VLLVCGLLVGTAGCGRDASEAGSPAVVNPELGITLSEVPEGLVVAVNQGRELVLEPTEEAQGGKIRFEVGPETEAVNLVAAVKEHEAGVTAATGGNYLGTTELMSHLGSAFISRGQFDLDADPIEEARIFVIHPAGNRLLTLVYSYPAATSDASQRAQSLLGVLGNIEVGHQ